MYSIMSAKCKYTQVQRKWSKRSLNGKTAAQYNPKYIVYKSNTWFIFTFPAFEFFRFEESMCFNSKSSLSAEFFSQFFENTMHAVLGINTFSLVIHIGIWKIIYSYIWISVREGLNTEHRIVHNQLVDKWQRDEKKSLGNETIWQWNDPFGMIYCSKIIMNGMFAGTAFILMAQKHCFIFDSNKKSTFVWNLSLFKIALCHGLVSRKVWRAIACNAKYRLRINWKMENIWQRISYLPAFCVEIN